MKKYMPLEGLRWSRDSGSTLCDTPQNGRSRTGWGVNITDPSNTYIGDGVIFDSLYPNNIEIGTGVHVTMGCIFLTHSLDTTIPKGIIWKQSNIKIGNHAFIGARTIICSNVEIGENSIVGAGSVVTHSIPANEIWAGNPARLIKRRI